MQQQQWVMDEYGNYYDVGGTEMSMMNEEQIHENNDGGGRANNTSAIATIPAGNVPPLSLSQLSVEFDKQKAASAAAHEYMNDSKYNEEENGVDGYAINAGNEEQLADANVNSINNNSSGNDNNYHSYQDQNVSNSVN